MSWNQTPNDAMQRFQTALQESASQYQMEAQLYAQQQALIHQQYQLRQQQTWNAAKLQGLQLGRLIKSRRTALQNTDPQALASFCGIPVETLLAMENGDTNAVSLSQMLVVIQALGLQLSAFPQV